jgi:hypothetical protein
MKIVNEKDNWSRITAMSIRSSDGRASAGKKRVRRSMERPEPLAKVLLRSASGQAREGAPLPPRAWYDAVGDRVARRTRPIRLENKVLTVRAATAVWAQELSFVAPTIVKRLAALGFEVDSLRFRVGPVDAPDRTPRPPRVKSVPFARPLSTELSCELDRIGDSALRETIARAAASNLAWQAARPATSATPAAPAPRSAARGNVPPDHTQPTGRGAARGKT